MTTSTSNLIELCEVSERNSLRDIFFGFREAVNGVKDDVYFDWLMAFPCGATRGVVAIEKESGRSVGGGIISLWKGIKNCRQIKMGNTNFLYVSESDQRRGLGVYIHNRMNEMLFRDDACLVFTYPNVKGLGMHQKNGAVIEFMTRFSKPLDYAAVFRDRIGIDMVSEIAGSMTHSLTNMIFCSRKTLLKTKDVIISEVSEFNEDIGDLWSKMSSGFLGAVDRDAEYLNWRYVRFPGGDYRIFSISWQSFNGYAICRIIDQSVYIYDFIINSDPEFADVLFCALAKHFERKGYRNLEITMFSGSPLTSLIKRNGFFKRGTKPIVFYFKDESTKADYTKNRCAWHFTSGDNNSVFF
jgi:hypothetical protein